MTFGFPAYYAAAFSPENTDADLRQLAKQTFAALGWVIKEELPHEIQGITPLSVWLWREKVSARFLPDRVIEITSQCVRSTQCLDWGRNRINVEQFMAEFGKQGGVVSQQSAASAH